MNAKEMIENAKRFQNALDKKADKNDRFLSWIHCYKCFSEKFNEPRLTEDDEDYLALNLGFYLASWGMYRASSFLLQKDYKIHTPVVKVLFEYKDLIGKRCDELDLGKIMKLSDEINEVYVGYYQEIYSERQDNKAKKENKQFYYVKPKKISDTLITKILMGTLGCTPAYDRFFIEGLKKYEKTKCHSYKVTSKNPY